MTYVSEQTPPGGFVVIDTLYCLPQADVREAIRAGIVMYLSMPGWVGRWFSRNLVVFCNKKQRSGVLYKVIDFVS